jgi:uncharacterized protein YjbI with pentapeptide repeats
LINCTIKSWFSAAALPNEITLSAAALPNEADFTRAMFSSNESRTFFNFNYIIFEQPNKVSFDENNLTKVSFAGSDITKSYFGYL